MGETDNKKRASRFLDVVNKREQPGGTIHYPFSLLGSGYKTALRQQLLRLGAAFPDYRLQVEDTVAEGDQVVVRGTFQGTHKGEWTGVAPTGKEVTAPFVMTVRLSQGEFADCALLLDHLALLQALGAMPVSENSDYSLVVYFAHEAHPLAERVFAKVTRLGYTVREFDLWSNAREPGDPSLASLVSENTLHFGSEARAKAEGIQQALGQLDPPCTIVLRAGNVECPGSTWTVSPRSLYVLLVEEE
jgi:predicted ester cyclase